jgi:hypothetical protein
MKVNYPPQFLLLAALFCLIADTALSFAVARVSAFRRSSASMYLSTDTFSFIETELRGAAMRLHTRSQAPKEGEAPEEAREPYVTTRSDYLQFLVDSKHVYEALEEIVDNKPDLEIFRNTGLERTQALETDIAFLMKEYDLERPAVGPAGLEYASKLKSIRSIPEFMCHYYNFYFAHTAGGRMIGKQMSSLLLDKKTLEFYKVCINTTCQWLCLI